MDSDDDLGSLMPYVAGGKSSVSMAASSSKSLLGDACDDDGDCLAGPSCSASKSKREHPIETPTVCDVTPSKSRKSKRDLSNCEKLWEKFGEKWREEVASLSPCNTMKVKWAIPRPSHFPSVDHFMIGCTLCHARLVKTGLGTKWAKFEVSVKCQEELKQHLRQACHKKAVALQFNIPVETVFTETNDCQLQTNGFKKGLPAPIDWLFAFSAARKNVCRSTFEEMRMTHEYAETGEEIMSGKMKFSKLVWSFACTVREDHRAALRRCSDITVCGDGKSQVDAINFVGIDRHSLKVTRGVLGVIKFGGDDLDVKDKRPTAEKLQDAICEMLKRFCTELSSDHSCWKKEGTLDTALLSHLEQHINLNILGFLCKCSTHSPQFGWSTLAKLLLSWT